MSSEQRMTVGDLPDYFAQLARIGAEHKLNELNDELAEIYRAFPVLAEESEQRVVETTVHPTTQQKVVVVRRSIKRKSKRGFYIGARYPLNVECPTCHAPLGQRCQYPSGHVGPVHIARVHRQQDATTAVTTDYRSAADRILEYLRDHSPQPSAREMLRAMGGIALNNNAIYALHHAGKVVKTSEGWALAR